MTALLPIRGVRRGAPDRVASTLEGASTASAERYHALDALRALAMLLGIVLHAAISYMPCRMPHLVWAIHDRGTAPCLDWLFWGLHAFRLPLFFLIAGFFSALVFERRGANAFLANRTRRVLWPFALACLVLLPIIYVIWCAGWLISGECPPGQVLRMKFRWDLQAGVHGLAHLWFLEHLYLMCLAFWCWRRLVSHSPSLAGRLPRIRAIQDRVLASRLTPFWLALPTAAVVLAAPAAFLDFHQSAAPPLARFLFNGTFFASGLALYRQRDRLTEMTAGYRWCLLAAIPPFVSLGLLLPLALTAALPWSGRLALALDSALVAWLMAFGLIGLFVRLFKSPSPAVRYLADASYYIYLAHMPLVALVQVALYSSDWPVSLKFCISAALPAAACLLTYHDLVRHSWLGELLNGRREPRSPGSLRRAWLYAAVPLTLAVLILAGVLHLREFCFDHNLHTVIPGEVYRSAVIKKNGGMNALIERLGLRTAVSLQGGDDTAAWFAEQKRACFSRGVQLYVVDFPEDGLPSREQIEALIAVLNQAPRPILLESRFGIARAGLASAVAVILSGAPPQAAHREYLLKHGSLDRTPASTENVIRAYQAWLNASQAESSPQRFREWISRHYQPDRVLQAVSGCR